MVTGLVLRGDAVRDHLTCDVIVAPANSCVRIPVLAVYNSLKVVGLIAIPSRVTRLGSKMLPGPRQKGPRLAQRVFGV